MTEELPASGARREVMQDKLQEIVRQLLADGGVE
jgi:hypothetical protein